jgi:hypothetical protein
MPNRTKKNRMLSSILSGVSVFSFTAAVRGDPGWSVTAHSIGEFIDDYASADALVAKGGGVTSIYSTSNTYDWFDSLSPWFGSGVQLAGLPAGDNYDFAL